MSKSKFLIKTLGGTVLSLLLAGTTQAQIINGAVNADNRFTVTVTQNGSIYTRYDSPSNYTWKTKQSFSMGTPKNLEQCRINVIVWGDNAVREGFAGVLKGYNGDIYTGGTGANGFESATQSASTSGGISSLPTPAEIMAMTGTTGPAPTVISNPVWGAASNYYQGSDFTAGTVPADMAWIKPQSTGNTTDRHWVFSSPCSDLVNPAVDMPGEHFQCYKLEKGDRLKEKSIVVSDQFGKSEVVIGRPRMMCNPSTKVHNGKEYGIRNKERHLVCYDYVKQSRTTPQNLKINNQFAPDDVISTKREMFCVPSSKEHTDKAQPKDIRFNRGDIRQRPEPRQQRR